MNNKDIPNKSIVRPVLPEFGTGVGQRCPRQGPTTEPTKNGQSITGAYKRNREYQIWRLVLSAGDVYGGRRRGIGSSRAEFFLGQYFQCVA